MTQDNLSPQERRMLTRLHLAEEDLRDTGFQIIRVAVKYQPDGVHFSTHISVAGDDKAKVTTDHIVLDCLREITQEWSQSAHSR